MCERSVNCGIQYISVHWQLCKLPWQIDNLPAEILTFNTGHCQSFLQFYMQIDKLCTYRRVGDSTYRTSGTSWQGQPLLPFHDQEEHPFHDLPLLHPNWWDHCKSCFSGHFVPVLCVSKLHPELDLEHIATTMILNSLEVILFYSCKFFKIVKVDHVA